MRPGIWTGIPPNGSASYLGDMTNPLIAPETPDLVWFRGADAVRFLDDLLSQEIAAAEPGRVLRSLLLQPHGKLAHILWVLRGEEEVGLVTDSRRGEDLATSLGRYRIRVDVEIDTHDGDACVVVGDESTDPGRWISDGGELVADVSWSKLARRLQTGPRPDLPAMSADQYEEARILSGEPRFGADVDDSTIPHESGLVGDTVDFTKGCFLGQELVARIDSRGGNVPKRLHLLELGDAAATVGTPVTQTGEEVGTITSRSGSVALAMLKRGVEPGDEVIVGGSRVTVQASRP